MDITKKKFIEYARQDRSIVVEPFNYGTDDGLEQGAGQKNQFAGILRIKNTRTGAYMTVAATDELMPEALAREKFANLGIKPPEILSEPKPAYTRSDFLDYLKQNGVEVQHMLQNGMFRLKHWALGEGRNSNLPAPENAEVDIADDAWRVCGDLKIPPPPQLTQYDGRKKAEWVKGSLEKQGLAVKMAQDGSSLHVEDHSDESLEKIELHASEDGTISDGQIVWLCNQLRIPLPDEMHAEANKTVATSLFPRGNWDGKSIRATPRLLGDATEQAVRESYDSLETIYEISLTEEEENSLDNADTAVLRIEDINEAIARHNNKSDDGSGKKPSDRHDDRKNDNNNKNKEDESRKHGHRTEHEHGHQ